MDNELMKQLALLNAMRNDDDDGEMFVSSVKEANYLLKQHMDPSGAKYRIQLVNYITDPRNRVLSEPDIYHNFIMDLFRVGDYDAAIKVCDFALKDAPKNMDILGDAMKACGDSSQFKRGEEYLDIAMSIPMHHWSWRLFLYSIDFIQTRFKANPDSEELYERAIDLAEQYIKYFPNDEHGYNQIGEILICANRRTEAIEKMKEYIFETKPDGPRSALICAQCCVTLLNLLDDSNQYDEIIDICDKGMLNTAQEQPSARIGYFMYRKALALDAKAHVEHFRIPKTIASALQCYQVAFDLNQDRDYANTIQQRFALLRMHADEPVNLIKRPLYVEES